MTALEHAEILTALRGLSVLRVGDLTPAELSFIAAEVRRVTERGPVSPHAQSILLDAGECAPLLPLASK